jgi:hypothetical protein
MKNMTTDKPMALHRREIIFSLIPFAFLLFRQRGFYLMTTPVDPMGWIDQDRQLTETYPDSGIDSVYCPVCSLEGANEIRAEKF